MLKNFQNYNLRCTCQESQPLYPYVVLNLNANSSETTVQCGHKWVLLTIYYYESESTPSAFLRERRRNGTECEAFDIFRGYGTYTQFALLALRVKKTNGGSWVARCKIKRANRLA